MQLSTIREVDFFIIIGYTPTMAGNPEKPYIGVTGITRVGDANAIAETFVTEGLTEEASSHRGMIGLLASQKTLSPNFQGRIKYPTLEQIRQIFEITKSRAFNTLHYHTYRSAALAHQLEVLLVQNGLYSDRLCQGLQLNIPWPPSAEVEKTKMNFPDLKIILQLGPKVLSENNPEYIAANLAPYQELINYVLIDPSGGRGRVFAVNTIAPTFNRIRELYPDLPLVFAGGFDGSNVSTRLWLLYQTVGTTNFGIDAEDGLRVQKRDKQSLTHYSIPRARRYVQNAALFFKTGSPL